tara:strand:+ start:67 stop:642 length:576 start_codon:yes stop_codon:yes gene_type:complete
MQRHWKRSLISVILELDMAGELDKFHSIDEIKGIYFNHVCPHCGTILKTQVVTPEKYKDEDILICVGCMNQFEQRVLSGELTQEMLGDTDEEYQRMLHTFSIPFKDRDKYTILERAIKDGAVTQMDLQVSDEKYNEMLDYFNLPSYPDELDEFPREPAWAFMDEMKDCWQRLEKEPTDSLLTYLKNMAQYE